MNPNDATPQTPEQVEAAIAARLDFIVKSREEGRTYEWIGNNMSRFGHGANISKVRVQTILRTHRPDLLGSVLNRRAHKQRR